MVPRHGSNSERGAVTHLFLEATVGAYGKHIKVQVYGVRDIKLVDEGLTDRFLVEAVEAIGMRMLDFPWVYNIKETLESQGEEPDPTEPEGVTGIAVLSTSHVAIHTWPHRGYAVIDMFSCTDFETDALVGVVEKFYQPRSIVPIDLSYALEMPELPAGD